MSKNALARVALAAALALGASAASAATIHVAAGAAGGNGSPGAPYGDIQAGVAAATAGDTVLVAPGIYYGTVELKSNVRLVSEQGAAATIIDGVGGGSAVQAAPEDAAVQWIEGFTVRNASVGVFLENRVQFWAPTWTTIRGCVVHDVVDGIVVYPSQAATIEQSVIRDVTIAIWTIWTSGPQVRNVTIERASFAGVWIYDAGASVTNTIFADSAAAFAGGSWWHLSSAGTIWGSNNDYWNLGARVFVDPWYGPVVDATTNDLFVDPLFVDTAASDLHLAPGSPLVDAGVDVGLPFLGAAPDVGAYEAGAGLLATVGSLAESFQAVSPAAFRNAAEQRRNALQQKILALVNDLTAIGGMSSPAGQLAAYRGALYKLDNDIWAKADGFYGGDPANDWITTQAEQARLYEKVTAIRQAIEAEIARLTAR